MAEKILLVDDDKDTLRLVGLMLQRQGYEVRAVDNGAEAITMAQEETPDMILLDIMMPEMDGYEVARRLRADPGTSEVPIIMFTAKSQVDDKVMGFEAGADDYLTKPTQPRELFAHMKAVLARSKKPETGAEAPAGERGYIIGVTAAKGGLGVTTMVLSLGVALHEATNKNVAIAEFRPGQGSISLELGYTRAVGLYHLLLKQPAEINAHAIENELIIHPTGVRLLLASNQPRDGKYVTYLDHFETILRQLNYLSKYVIADLGPSLTPLVEKVAHQCDELIIILEPIPHTINQTQSLINDYVEMGIGESRLKPVLINRVRSGVQLPWSQVQDQIDLEIEGIFTPAPELTYQASQSNLPVILQQPDSLTAQQYKKLAEKIAQRTPV
ncbi:MAG: response regulator [Anaerolineales bacterium]|jgi:DNA-binding response OmpR family regulator